MQSQLLIEAEIPTNRFAVIIAARFFYTRDGNSFIRLVNASGNNPIELMKERKPATNCDFDFIGGAGA